MYYLRNELHVSNQIFTGGGGGGGGGYTLKTIDKQDVEITFIECACLK